MKFKPWCDRPEIDITKIQNYQEGRKIYGYIYMTIFPNEKVYVGQAEHIINSRTEKDYFGSGTIFRKAQNKYGKEKLKKRILRVCYALEEYNEWERKYIWLFKACDPKFGYNILKGSANDWSGGLNPTKIPGVIEKITKASTGRKQSVKQIDKSRQRMLKYWDDPEWRDEQLGKYKRGDEHYIRKDGFKEGTRDKMSESLREFYQTDDGIKLRKEKSEKERTNKHANTKGRIVSEETKNRMSISGLNRNGNTRKYRGVIKKVSGWVTSLVYKNERYSFWFDTEIDAAMAYNEMAKVLFGDRAKLNVIKE